MITVEVRYKELEAFASRIARAGGNVQQTMLRAHTRMGAKVLATARLYSPKSPTLQERKKSSKATKAQWAAAEKRKLATATSRAMPGTLQNSIMLLATASIAEVFVPINSPAGAYAWKMHEEKGKTWKNRGVGTIAKGPKADEKFIERAINDNEQALVSILDSEIDKLRRKLS
jgi:hypothetical protein